jgi:hypothetical protein
MSTKNDSLPKEPLTGALMLPLVNDLQARAVEWLKELMPTPPAETGVASGGVKEEPMELATDSKLSPLSTEPNPNASGGVKEEPMELATDSNLSPLSTAPNPNASGGVKEEPMELAPESKLSPLSTEPNPKTNMEYFYCLWPLIQQKTDTPTDKRRVKKECMKNLGKTQDPDFIVFPILKNTGDSPNKGIALHASSSLFKRLARKHNLDWHAGTADLTSLGRRESCMNLLKQKATCMKEPVLKVLLNFEEWNKSHPKKKRKAAGGEKASYPLPEMKYVMFKKGSTPAIASELEGYFPYADEYFSTMLYFHKFENELRTLSLAKNSIIDSQRHFWKTGRDELHCECCGWGLVLAFWVYWKADNKRPAARCLFCQSEIARKAGGGGGSEVEASGDGNGQLLQGVYDPDAGNSRTAPVLTSNVKKEVIERVKNEVEVYTEEEKNKNRMSLDLDQVQETLWLSINATQDDGGDEEDDNLASVSTEIPRLSQLKLPNADGGDEAVPPPMTRDQYTDEFVYIRGMNEASAVYEQLEYRLSPADKQYMEFVHTYFEKKKKPTPPSKFFDALQHMQEGMEVVDFAEENYDKQLFQALIVNDPLIEYTKKVVRTRTTRQGEAEDEKMVGQQENAPHMTDVFVTEAAYGEEVGKSGPDLKELYEKYTDAWERTFLSEKEFEKAVKPRYKEKGVWTAKFCQELYAKYLAACKAHYGFLGALIHVDPGVALNVALAIIDVDGTVNPEEVLAWWLLVHPKVTGKFLQVLADNELLGRGFGGQEQLEKLSSVLEEGLEAKFGDESGTLIKLDQKHGDVVEVPVGWSHIVVNAQKSLKAAVDIIRKGQLHRCVLSHLVAWRPFTDRGQKLTTSYLPIADVALKPFLTALATKSK